MSFGNSSGGFFGSGAKQSSTVNETVSQSAGFSELGTGANAIAVQGSNNQFSLSDFGAIDTARKITEAALAQVELSGKRASDTVSDVIHSGQATIGNAIDAVSQSSRAETENILIQGFKYLAIVGVVFGIAYGVRAMRKSA